MAWPLVIVPPVLLFAFVGWYGVNTAFADELHYSTFLELFDEGGGWRNWIWQQHNEHRVVALKLLMLALLRLTHWSQRVEMFCGAALTVLMIWSLWRVFPERTGEPDSTRRLFAFAPVSWLACSFAQYENQLYGLMVCHYFTAAGGVLALCHLGRRGRGSLVAACLGAVVAATSIASGLLVFPAGIAVLAGRRSSWKRWLIWCGLGIATTTLYMRHYLRPPHTRPFQWTFDDAFRIVKLFLSTAGAALAGGGEAWAIVLGVALCVVSAYVLWHWVRSEPDRRAAASPFAGVLLLGFGSAVMVGVGRAFLLSPDGSLASRYITHSNLAWYGVVLLLALGDDIRSLRVLGRAATPLLVLGLLAANVRGLWMARFWYRERLVDQYVLQTHRLQSDAVLGRLADVDGLRPKLEYLERQGLSAFASPQRLLMTMNAAAGAPTAPIGQGRSIEQRLACPVENLRDVAVLLVPAEHASGGSVRVAVESDGLEIARRSFATGAIEDRSWARVPLSRALSCRGRRLSIRLESDSSAESEMVRGWATVPFYDGELTQAGVGIQGRRLAIALNADHFGVLD